MDLADPGGSALGLRFRLAEEHGAELVGRFLLHVRRDVLVQVGGDRGGAVAEALTHDLDRDAGFEQERGGGVAGVVRPVGAGKPSTVFL